MRAGAQGQGALGKKTLAGFRIPAKGLGGGNRGSATESRPVATRGEAEGDEAPGAVQRAGG